MKWKMNIKVELLATALFAVLTLQAVPVAVKGDFATAGADGLPEGWMIHQWDGFMPLAKFARVEADGKSAFRICEANGRAGAGALAMKREPCHAGDILRLRWSMRGKGKGLVRVQNYNAKGEANGGSASPAAELTESWKQHEFVYSIGNGPSGESVAFQVGLGCDKGSEIEFADVVCDIERRFFDDYQTAGKRAGAPEIITDIIAPGLMEKTKQGVYRTAATLAVPLGTAACALPALADVNPYLEGGFRLYSFGRPDRIDAQLKLTFASEKGDLTLTVDHRADRADLVCTLSEKNGARIEEMKVPYAVLPADFLVRASKSGDWNFSVRSLADSSTHAAKGKSTLLAGCEAPFTASLTLTKTGATAAEVTLDNLLFGRAALEMECPLAPCKVEVAPTFDPVEAGWPLVFADEFDGDKIDETKWFSPTTEKAWQNRAYVKDGVLHILADWDEKHEKLTTASLWSAQKYGYGYFEAKLRFTTKNGWWAAFWLYGTSNGNPFVDGFEIDIFEDYYTRDRNPQAPRKGILDHNLHILNGTYLKSWNYNSKLPGTLDEFYRLGCKWTPFEISYYLNGKLIASKSTHSGYNSVTFDAVQHATGIVPLHAIVSGQIMRPGWAQYDKTGVTFPDDYAVDYVRIYAYPDAPEKHPSVRVTSGTDPVMVATDSKMTVTAEVRPATKTASPVKTVYLFDNGYLLDYKTQAPYTFDVTFSKEYLGKTRFGKPGRSGKPPAYDSFPHVFTVFAQDAEGRVGRSETFTKIVARMDASQPYEGVAQKLPGALKVGRYDAGGPNVAYWDGHPGNSGGGKWRSDEDVDCGETWVGNITPGEWLTYSVDVERTGTYVGRFRYGTPDRTTCALQLLVDGKFAGRFACQGHDPKKGWASDTVSTLPDIRLTAGRHRLTIVCEGRYNFTGLEFELTRPELPDEVPAVRADHPRMFFNRETWPAVKAAAEGPARGYRDALIKRCAAYPENPTCSGTEPAPKGHSSSTPLPPVREWGRGAAECALAWRFTGERSFLEKAKRMLTVSIAAYHEAYRNRRAVNWYSTTRILALCAYDWLYDDLTDDERRAIIVPLMQHVVDVQPGGGKPEIVRRNGGPGGYMSGHYGVDALMWYSGIATLGDGYCDEQARQNLKTGYDYMRKLFAFREEGSGDDGPLTTGTCGYAMGQYPWAHFNYFHTLASATGLDAAPCYPGLGLFPNFIWWNWIRGRGMPLQFGYGDTPHGMNDLGVGQLHEHLLQYAYFFSKSNPDAGRLATTLLKYVPDSRLDSDWPMYPYLLASVKLPEPFTEQELAAAPRARHFETSGQIMMRSAWEPGATYCMFTAGGTLSGSGHKHFDENNFIIYKDGFQAVDTGSRARQTDYNLAYYYAQTVAHNCLLIHKPNEPMPHHWGLKYDGPEGKLCDGGQTVYGAAKVLAFETNPLYTYVASDAAPAYPGKCSECVRQFLYLTDDCFVVYDRVTATQAEYAKEWLLHTDGEPVFDGEVMSSLNHKGRIFCRTLLPEGAVRDKVGGPGKEFWSNGKNWELDQAYVKATEAACKKSGLGGPWFGKWRMSVKPAAAAMVDRFLHVINVVGENGVATPLESVRVADATRDGAKVTIPNATVGGKRGTLEATVWFNRTGMIGGELELRLLDTTGKELSREKRPLTQTVHGQSGVFDRTEE